MCYCTSIKEWAIGVLLCRYKIVGYRRVCYRSAEENIKIKVIWSEKLDEQYR